MSHFKILFLMCFVALSSACGTKTRVYYWEKQNTGGERFAADHMGCIQHADMFPFSTKSWYPDAPETLDLRLRLQDGGIWGNFSPYVGAQPLFVNTKFPSSTVSYNLYYWCMRRAGYQERRPYSGPMTNK